MISEASFLQVVFSFILLFLIPGYALYTLLFPRVKPELIRCLVVSIALSIAIVPLLSLLLFLVHIKLDEFHAKLIMLPFVVVALLGFIRRTRNGSINRHIVMANIDVSFVVLLFILVLTLVLAFSPTRDMAFSPGTDSSNLTLISRLFVDSGGIPTSYEPYAPVEVFTYHFGFFSLVALFHWVAGVDVAKSMFLVGQLFVALAPLVIYFFSYKLLKDNRIAIASAFIIGIITIFPTYQLNWARYPQAAGLTLLPAAAVALIEWLDARDYDFKPLLVSSMLFAGIFCLHYRVLLALLYFVFVYLGYRVLLEPKNIISLASKVTILGTISMSMVSPWLWNLFTRSGFLASVSAPPPFFFSIERLSRLYFNFSNYLFIIGAQAGYFVLALSFVLAAFKREKAILILFAWSAVLLGLSNPYWFDLPLSGMIDFVTVLSLLYIPCSIISGFFIVSFLDIIRKVAKNWFLIITLLVSLVGVSTIGVTSNIYEPDRQRVSAADLQAMDWIRENTVKEAKFLIDTNEYAGYPIPWDAGSWIPFFTRRYVSAPLMTVFGEQATSKEILSEALELHYAANSPDSDESLKIFQKYDITHVYIGQYGGYRLKADVLEKSPNFKLVYHREKVYIFEFVWSNL